MKTRWLTVLCAAATGAIAPTARADVKLPAVLGSHMVLQRDAPIRLWGWADDGETVKVTLDGQSVSTVAKGGRWMVALKPHVAGGPYSVTIAGKNTVSLDDVLIGEVWVCGGQSNMEWALGGSFEPQAAIAASGDDNLRLFNVKNARSATVQNDVTGSWNASSPQTSGGFSAVGYYFGRALRKALGVPVGLVQSDWGGTPAESWIPEASVAGNPVTKPVEDGFDASMLRYQGALKMWEMNAAQARADGKPVPARPSQPWKPGELYNAMIDPIKGLRVRGAIWYQGESNAGRADAYRTAFPMVIQSWRDAFGEPDMPFLAVQLAPFSASGSNNSEYAVVREAIQLSGARMKNVGSVVITDIGEEKDIHPRKKEPVGERLALVARSMVYREKVTASGPTVKGWRMKGDTATVSFASADGGLVAKPVDSRGQAVEAGKLLGFQVAGADGRFVDADAKIIGRDTVEVRAPGVSSIAAVRFGFVNFPNVNLWNGAGLPAVPFRTDTPKN